MSSSQTAPLANSNILLIRHAERPDSGQGISPAGRARANAYVNYFKNYTLGGTSPGVPVEIGHLFAAADSSESERPSLTITPLALALGVILLLVSLAIVVAYNRILTRLSGEQGMA